MADEILRGATERETLTAELEREAVISSAALENMAQGLSMYDEHDRLVTFNRKYAELYGIAGRPARGRHPDGRDHRPPGRDRHSSRTRPSIIVEIVRSSAEAGGQSRSNCAMAGSSRSRMRPTPAGGWVATHEDVTTARRAADRIA